MYSTAANLLSRFSPAFLNLVADEDGNATPDTPLLEWAIADADARIDALLGHRYLTPFTSPSWIITELSSVLAAQNLARRKPNVAGDFYHGDFSRAEELLGEIAAGQVSLPFAVPRAREISSSVSEDERVFQREKINGF